jgi:hypothetical protein
VKVTLRSDNQPDVLLEAGEAVNLLRLEQHIRTLIVARNWLKKELARRTAAPK